MDEKTARVNMMLRRRDNPNNVVSVECNAFDMNMYVDLMRHLIHDSVADYMIIEPYKIKEYHEGYIF